MDIGDVIISNLIITSYFLIFNEILVDELIVHTMSLFSDSSSSIPGAIISAVYALYMIWLGTNE
ncbi:MAG: hypothetical protein PHS39_08650 [Atribacterota bacterium]|nr:hypothetical protein [Atribacterota bacterium]